MGTRCVTIFKNRQVKYSIGEDNRYHEDGMESVELFRMYRHWDGYPEGHGMSLAESVIEADAGSDRNNRNWAACMLGHLFTDYQDYEIEEHSAVHGDLGFLYVVEGDYANYGGKCPVEKLPVTITVWEYEWDCSYETVMEHEPLFTGSAYEFAERFGR